MLKWITTFITFLTLAGSISPANAPCAVVTEISIHWTQNGHTSYRIYTEPEKVDTLLLCLRAVETDTGSAAPESPIDADCTFHIRLSDGSTKRNRLCGTQYDRDHDGSWERIKPESALRLYLYIASTPDDS